MYRYNACNKYTHTHTSACILYYGNIKLHISKTLIKGIRYPHHSSTIVIQLFLLHGNLS